MTVRRGERRRKLLDYRKERRGYSHLKEEALDRTMWTAGLGRGFGPVVVGRVAQKGIATGYRLDGPGIKSHRGRDFSHTSNRPWGPPNLLYNVYRVFPGGNAAGSWC
jgi:hypothetical protein